MLERHRLLARYPGKQVGVVFGDQPFILVEFGIRQGLDGLIGKAAQHQIHLAHAPMPGPEQRLAAAYIQSLAALYRSAHGSSLSGLRI